MTRDEYFIMKIRQLKILKNQKSHIDEQIKEINTELEQLSDKEFSKLKQIADGTGAYQNL